MGLNSVQSCLKGLLDGLESPQLDPLEAVIQPPVWSDAADHPYAFIWGGKLSEKRQTAPRSIRQTSGGVRLGGYQKGTWDVVVRLATVLAQDDPIIETAFPCLVDAALRWLNTAVIPIIFTDPVTGQKTQILTIAENVTGAYATARVTIGGQGIVRFAYEMVVEVEEKIDWGGGVP